MTGVLLDAGSLGGDVDLRPITETLPDWRVHAHTQPAELHRRIADADVVVTNKVVLDAAAMDAAPALKLIAVTATGVNNVDLYAAAQRDIRVCNATGYATAAVAQHVFALLLNLVTQLPRYRQAVADGAWARSEHFCLLDFPITELAGKTLGIVGYGELGQAVARLARALGMEVLAWRRPGSDQHCADGTLRLPLEQLLPAVSVLSLHCPLTADTTGLIGAEELTALPRGAWLLNTARGGLVDEVALIQALREGRLAGAGIDVLSTEPPPADHPLLTADLPNLLVTPHIAWASREARQRLVAQVGGTIAAFLAGRPRQLVN